MNPARSVPGSRGTAVPAVGADSVSHHGSVLRHSPPPRIRTARHRLRRRVGARLRLQRPAATRPWVMGRSGPGPGGRLPSHTVGLFRCSREPKVSLPRRSRARRPTLPDRLRGQRSTRFARSAPLVIGRLIAGAHNPAHIPAVNETANNQGPQADVRFSRSDTSTAVPRPNGRKKVKIYTARGSGRAAAGCVCQ